MRKAQRMMAGILFFAILIEGPTWASTELPSKTGSQEKTLFYAVSHSMNQWMDRMARFYEAGSLGGGENWKVKVRPLLQFRYRQEYRDDFNFNDRTFEDDDIHLLRTRFGLDMRVGNFQVYAEGQDAEAFAGSAAHKSAAFVNQLDVYQLYAVIPFERETLPLAVKVGRQELKYGEERFVGAFGWSNVARVFDAVKLIYTPFAWLQVDSWFSQVRRVNRRQADAASHNENFYGLYAMLRPIKSQELDVFFFVRHNRNNELVGEKNGERGQLKEYTAGSRLKGAWQNFNYGIEWALQSGSRAHDDIRAWAWHSELGYTFASCPWKPYLAFEYNYGSGDNDPKDGVVENFDNLYPTNHRHYGYMDFVSLRNIHNFRLRADLKPYPRLLLRMDYHWNFLATNGSAWFNAAQKVLRVSTPGASTTLGQEIDLFVNWKVSRHLEFLLGYSHFHGGAFLKDTGASDNANFFYFQTAIQL